MHPLVNYTVFNFLSPGFSIFVYLKVNVYRIDNLGEFLILIPVYSQKSYGLFTEYIFTYPYIDHFRW